MLLRKAGHALRLYWMTDVAGSTSSNLGKMSGATGGGGSSSPGHVDVPALRRPFDRDLAGSGEVSEQLGRSDAEVRHFLFRHAPTEVVCVVRIVFRVPAAHPDAHLAPAGGGILLPARELQTRRSGDRRHVADSLRLGLGYHLILPSCRESLNRRGCEGLQLGEAGRNLRRGCGGRGGSAAVPSVFLPAFASFS